jgi:anti-sigma B factor antagonist
VGELGIRVERQDGRVCLAVTGELDLATAPALLDAVAKVLAAGDQPNVVLDLVEVTFLDSSGLGALLQARAETLAAGGGLTLDGVASGPRRVIDIAGLASTFGLEA